jgi:hypothetical protein
MDAPSAKLLQVTVSNGVTRVFMLVENIQMEVAMFSTDALIVLFAAVPRQPGFMDVMCQLAMGVRLALN